MTPVNIFKMQTTEHYSPVLLRSWADTRWLLIYRLANLFWFFSPFHLSTSKYPYIMFTWVQVKVLSVHDYLT